MTGVRGKLWSINLTLQGAEDQGATAGLLPGSNQEYLGRSPAECVQSRGILPGNGGDGGHWEFLPWLIHHRPGGNGHLDRREGAGIGRVDDYIVGCVPQVPAVQLHCTAEVTPTGVGLRAVGHPRHTGRIRTC